ncbi:hypothetical protein ALNOE001_01220 [Candidatus Methanobinarius endosymbioticus]|uniref:Uncharacterized protein n=1 Tax=Candidatus Methanobinarius endosymbioticus TaxID=2006182 RepID=A0A366ME68_9EURY|nr:hypothetical protein ALNOE001_01220 [Candidatus Methanobinarius endosymbioticus]
MDNTITGQNISFYLNGILIDNIESIEGYANIIYLVNSSQRIIHVNGDYDGHGSYEINTKTGELLIISDTNVTGNISFDKKEYLLNETSKGL